MLLFQDQAHNTEIDRETEETEETVRKYNASQLHNYCVFIFKCYFTRPFSDYYHV